MKNHVKLIIGLAGTLVGAIFTAGFVFATMQNKDEGLSQAVARMSESHEEDAAMNTSKHEAMRNDTSALRDAVGDNRLDIAVLASQLDRIENDTGTILKKLDAM
jgi:hypothetical protein